METKQHHEREAEETTDLDNHALQMFQLPGPD